VQLEQVHAEQLKELLGQGISILDALPRAVDGDDASGGLWRFYSENWPARGVRRWNSESRWRQAWDSTIPAGAFAFGEDIFGNQLMVVPRHETVLLWNHQDGRFADLYCDPVTLLSTVATNGIDWIDFYADGSLDVARRTGLAATDFHLHWTTPLVLGGAVSDSNISLVERESHLVSHAKLWSQIRGLSPGASVIPKD
jgi:hypothetical protein